MTDRINDIEAETEATANENTSEAIELGSQETAETTAETKAQDKVAAKADVTEADAEATAVVEPQYPRANSPITRRKSAMSFGSTAAAVAILASLGGALAYNFTGAEPAQRSVMTKGPQSIDGTPAGAQLASSSVYQQTLYDSNTRGATEALETPGKSFMSVPDEPVTENPLPEVKVVQAPTLPPANEVAAPTPEPEVRTETRTVIKEVYVERPRTTDWDAIKQLSGRMNQQAGQIADQANPAGSKLEVVVQQDLYQSPDGRPVGVQVGGGRATPSLLPEGIAPLTSNFQADLLTTSPYYTGRLEREPSLPVNPGTPLGAGREVFNGNYLANAGDITYAVVLNGSDTDTPGPVVAKLVRGPLKGARLIGAFAPNRETTAMIVQFDRVVLPDGTNLDTAAYALDSKDATLAVRSSYDGRYLQRYGPKLAGAFVEGLGAALATTGTRVIATDGATIVTRPEQSAEEALYAGAANVGDQFANEISDLGPRGPLVRLSAGKLIGVLFTQNVERVGF